MPLYDSHEVSTFLGRDVRLYSFKRGNKIWHYNSGDRDYVYNGNRYYQLAITDDGMKQKSEIATDDFTITVPSYHPIALAFRGTTPSDLIKITVRQVQYGDTEAPLMWTGYVSTVRIKDEVSADIICNTQVAYLNRAGLRLTYQRQCPHALYDTQCRVNPHDFMEQGTIRAGTIGGNAFYVDLLQAPPTGTYSGRFTNGYIEWKPDPAYFERRSIHVHDQALIILLGTTEGLSDGQLVNCYWGCARVPASCHLFNNIKNYGGYPMMPGKSPFDGDPVF